MATWPKPMNSSAVPYSPFRQKDLIAWSKEEKLDYFRRKLDRPVRVCGMVKNVGEPGGGPFWAKNQDGSVSLQVVESAQIDLENPAQKAIFDEATHFNPVDLVCGLKDHNGRKYDLPAYRDALNGIYHGQVERWERVESAGVARFVERGHGRLEYNFCGSPAHYVQSRKNGQ